MRRPRMHRMLAALAVTALAATGCGGGGGGGAGGGGGSLGAIDLSDVTFTVGSKEFTEQLILGEIAVQALQATGADVRDVTTITGSTNVRTALTAGEIDMYWEYTGTGWTTHLQREVSTAPKGDALYTAVAEADKANGIVWLDQAPLNNTYAVATVRGRDQQLGVTNLTEYGALVNRDPNAAKLCAAAEFLTRDDGLPTLERTYGFDLPTSSIAELELSLIPGQVVGGVECAFGEVFATDGAIAANDLVIIEDDKQAIVAYNLAMTVRQEVLDTNPRLAEVFNPIAAKLTNEVMVGLNERVDVKGELPDDVAEDFLRTNGFTA